MLILREGVAQAVLDVRFVQCDRRRDRRDYRRYRRTERDPERFVQFGVVDSVPGYLRKAVAGYRQGVVLDFDQFDSAGGEHLVDRSLLPARHAVGQPVRKSARRRIRGRGTQETGRGVRMGRPGFLRHNRAVPVK